MIYAAFSVYLLGIFFAGRGIYRLWADIVKPRAVNWALLPGTVVSQMAYIFGCLITGGEVRRAKLIGAAGNAGRGKSAPSASEPTTEAAPKLRHIGPIVAAFCCIVACAVGIIVAHALLGEPVITTFVNGEGFLAAAAALPKALPATASGFWDQIHAHVDLIRRAAAACTELDWLDWRVPLFVYLATCLSIRLAPVSRSLRATLGAVVALAAIIAVVGLIWQRFDRLMDSLWPLVTYVWSSLLLLLMLTLIARGIVSLVQALLEKKTPPAR